jgi:hypothetical protein
METVKTPLYWYIKLYELIKNNYFTRQYNPEDNSEHHTRRRENLKCHTMKNMFRPNLTIIRCLSRMSENV